MIAWIKALAVQPRNIGAIAPSSSFLANAIALSALSKENDSLIIDVGAGTGRIAEALLHKGCDSSRILMMEPHPNLAKILEKKFPQIPLIQETFQDGWSKIPLGKPLTIVSSLPLFSLATHDRKSYFRALTMAMESRNVIRCMQYTYLPFLPWMDARTIFGTTGRPIARNIPPAWIWDKTFDH